MGHSSSHDTPHLPRGLLRSSLHSRGCKPTTTETPTLFHPGRHGGNTQCSCCCRYREKLAPRRWLTWSSKCLNTFPTHALRPRNYHFKRASRSEGQACCAQEKMSSTGNTRLQRCGSCGCEVPLGERPCCLTALFCARPNDDGGQHGATQKMSMADLALASSRLSTTRQGAGESENGSIP